MGRKRKRDITPGVVAYCRVSTEEQAVSGLGLAAQERTIREECLRRGVEVLALHTDAGISAKNLNRPALNQALNDLESGRGSVLMVAKLDRLTRSVIDAAGLLKRADAAGWGLVALDVAVDTTTPQGAAMTQVLAVFAELERRLTGERTKSALAVKKAQGVRLGRQVQLPDEVRQLIGRRRTEGAGWTQIARELNDEGIPTAQGGRRWYPATVRYVCVGNER